MHLNKKVRVSLLGLIFLAGLPSFARAAGPSLIYSPSDIPALREKAQSEKFRELWKTYLQQADKYCDSASPDYANPDRAEQDLEEYDFDIRGAMAGKRLTKYMQNLGLAHHLTGEAKYRDLGIKLLLAYAQAIPVTHPFMVKGYAGCKGDLMRGLAVGYDQFGADLTPEQRKIVLAAARDYVGDYLKFAEDPGTWWFPYHNYMGVCGGSAGCLSLQLADLDPKLSQDYLARVVDRIKQWLDQAFDQQGANYEGVGYSLYALDDSTLFIDALKRAGGEDLFQHPSMKRVFHYYTMSMLPGEKITENRNESGYWPISEIALKYATEQKDGLGSWLYNPEADKDLLFFRLVWDKDVPPVTPEEAGTPLAESFEGRGLSIWRTGWKKGDVMFAVESGPFHAVTHNQADKGQITLYGYGYRWLCDSGYGSSLEPHSRCSSFAHNCIQVDGKGQAIAGCSFGTNGRTLKYENNDVYGYALTDSTEAYRQNIQRTGTVDEFKTNPNIPMDHALRHCIFMRPSDGAPAYAVVLDNIDQDGKEHEYTWQILSWPNLEIQATGQTTAAVTPNPEAEKEIGPGRMFVFLDAASAPVLSVGFYEAGDKKPPTPRLQAACKAVNPYFASVLIPTDGSVKAPDVKFEQTSEVTTIQVNWPHRTDRVVWKKAGREKPEIMVSGR